MTDLGERLRQVDELLRQAYGDPGHRRPGEFLLSDQRGHPVDVLVATLLSQSTTDRQSARALEALRRRFCRWDRAASAAVEEIAELIAGAGLQQQKAQRISRILAGLKRVDPTMTLSFLHHWDTGSILSWLRSFEGVGPKTAACVALFALGRHQVPVDTHVRRVLGRLGIAREKDTATLQRKLSQAVPRGRGLSLHLNLMRLGRSVCRPRRPRCGCCPLRALCPREGVRD